MQKEIKAGAHITSLQHSLRFHNPIKYLLLVFQKIHKKWEGCFLITENKISGISFRFLTNIYLLIMINRLVNDDTIYKFGLNAISVQKIHRWKGVNDIMFNFGT